MDNGEKIANALATLKTIFYLMLVIAGTLFLIKTGLWFYLFTSIKESIFGIIIALIFDWG